MLGVSCLTPNVTCCFLHVNNPRAWVNAHLSLLELPRGFGLGGFSGGS